MTTPAALHSSEDPSWGTPLWIIDAVREALGGEIELDPCSSVAANVGVRATRIIAPPDDGLVQPWIGERVFVNPPGGNLGARKTDAPNVADKKRAISDLWQTDSLAVAWSQSNGWGAPLHPRFSLCVPRKRIAFDRINPDGTRTKGPSPTHGNLIVGMGCDPSRFERAMVGVGQVMGARA